MRVAVVGHVEWVTFAPVHHLPAPGEIVHAIDPFDEAAGGGGVAAVKLGGPFLTALGDDPLGDDAAERLRSLGVDLHAVRRGRTRRAFTHVDDAGERTITVMGDRLVPHGSDPLPWDVLAECDGVYFTGGDIEAARHARQAPVLVATPRAVETLSGAGVALDALVYSAGDEDEARWAEQMATEVRYRVATRGSSGGQWLGADGRTGAWAAAELPGPVVDAFGCGDSFAAGLTAGLARGGTIDEALALAAEWGARTLTLRGPYGTRHA